MKKILTLVLAGLLVISFAGCAGNNDTTNSTDTTEDTTAQVTTSVDTDKPSEVVHTVETWLAAHKDLVDEVSSTTGYTITATGNEITLSIVIENIDDVENLMQNFADTDNALDALPKETKLENMKFYVNLFGTKSDMPLPEKATENFYDADGVLIWSSVRIP